MSLRRGNNRALPLISLVMAAIILLTFSKDTSASPMPFPRVENQVHQDYLQPRSVEKRSSVDFMGMRVSYPQYLRLKSIQNEVIKMDQTIRRMVRLHNPIVLARNPYWMELLEFYDTMKKMLPNEYLETVGYEDPIPI